MLLLAILFAAAAPRPALAQAPGGTAEAEGSAGASAPTAPGPAEGASGTLPMAGSLVVVVDGLESEAGNVAFALYGSAEAYAALSDPVRKGRLEIADGSCRWRLDGLPAGDYALSVYHDEDADGELDKGAFGIPTEPYGFSNDARGVTGPPPWSKARFRLDAGPSELRVRLR